MKRYISLIFIILIHNISAQEASKDSLGLDTDYREDQFYAGITYNLLIRKPEEVSQQNFSRGLHFGLLRDMPFNEDRTLAVAVGVGYSYDLVYSNILGLRQNEKTAYYIGDLKKNNISKSYFETHSLEVPIEFRWRNSTPQSHKFWRVYGGIKVAYIYSAKNFFTQDELNISFDNPDIIDAWQFKIYGAFGYNTWNFYVQYGFLPLYINKKTETGQSLEVNLLQIGLMFYIF